MHAKLFRYRFSEFFSSLLVALRPFSVATGERCENKAEGVHFCMAGPRRRKRAGGAQTEKAWR